MQRGIQLCRRCHSFVHRQFGHKELGRFYNTKEKLLQAPTIQTYARWARKETNE